MLLIISTKPRWIWLINSSMENPHWKLKELWWRQVHSMLGMLAKWMKQWNLKRTVSDIKHEVRSQFLQNQKTNIRVSGIAKELQKLHWEAVQNTTNSVTDVAVLFASIAFLAIFNLPGKYVTSELDEGKANIADHVGFRIFCLLNATFLFISLAVVVVVHITLVAWDTNSQKQVSVVNKQMWAVCACPVEHFCQWPLWL